MRKVLVNFELSVSNDGKTFICVGKPNYVFSGEFDRDNDESFSSLCAMEYNVINLAHYFKMLGYQVAVIRKEVSHVDIE